MVKTLGIIIVVALLAVGFFLGIKTIGKNRINNSSVQNSANSGTNSTKSGKTKVPCAYYEKKTSGFKPGDTSPLPSDIAQLGSGETLCGSVPDYNTVYYLTDKSDSEIEDLYKTKMLEKKCGVAAKITPAPGHESYLLNISFKCPEGHYYVGTAFNDNGYWVTFNPPRE